MPDHHRLDAGGCALEHLITHIMAVAVVDLLEVVDVDHCQVMIVFTRHGPQEQACMQHKGAPIGDLGQGVDIGLHRQPLGHDVVVQLDAAQLEKAVDRQAAQKSEIAQDQQAAQVHDRGLSHQERVEQQAGDRGNAQEGPAAQGQDRGTVKDAGTGQCQPDGLRFGRQAKGDQAQAQSNDRDEHQVEYVEMPVTGNKAKNDGEHRHYADKQQRQTGKALAALEADNQVEQQPDGNAGDIGQAAKFAQFFEVMLGKFSLQGRWRRLFGDLGFNGFEHRAPWTLSDDGLRAKRV